MNRMDQLVTSLVLASTHTHTSGSSLSVRGLSDLFTSLAYFTIPLAIMFFARKKKVVKFKWMYFLFTLFILFCGITHFLHFLRSISSSELLLRIESIAVFLTAVVSIGTAILIWAIMPKLLRIPSPGELEEANKEITYLAHYDVLTGLINRNYFNIVLEEAVEEARKNKQQLAVAFIDLDRFKVINDTYGHGIGDLLLKEVAQRILRSVSDKDIVSRQGGDEFLLLLRDVSPQEVEKTINQLLQSLSATFDLDGKEVHCTPSIGISCFPTDGQDIETLIKYADLAMYKAKEKGRNNYQFFTCAMSQEIVTKSLLENDLRKALGKGELEVYYQPQLDVKTNKIVATEALLRWHHPERGFISPVEFIPLAEETGLISSIGKWVLEEACRQTKHWRNQGHDLGVSVNLSSFQLISNNVVDMIQGILVQQELDPHHLTLEVTESMAITNLTDTLDKLKQLQDFGVNIALDDFGTGYSSLSYLSTLPINTVKIDKSFIDDITNKTKKEIVKSVSNIAHSLGLKVVAEGVEDAHQVQLIQSFGIEMIQGYYISKPIPKEELEANFLKD
ncbi:EAL domain-containing protein [Lysinibacillus antri]|uniref:EAL domain-containing protein n=2 Tax=Lysinibacillus antri TaxID=2498145 RepID=A0A432L7Z8_9BACI|nr:EAL domain-containing protein [Lysinibacillus antri]